MPRALSHPSEARGQPSRMIRVRIMPVHPSGVRARGGRPKIAGTKRPDDPSWTTRTFSGILRFDTARFEGKPFMPCTSNRPYPRDLCPHMKPCPMHTQYADRQRCDPCRALYQLARLEKRCARLPRGPSDMRALSATPRNPGCSRRRASWQPRSLLGSSQLARPLRALPCGEGKRDARMYVAPVCPWPHPAPHTTPRRPVGRLRDVRA